FVDCIPKTKVAESAEVMKNIETNRIAIMDKTIPIGNSLNTPNRTSEVSNPVKSTPLFWTSMAVVPNAANQIKEMIVGISKTPKRNWRMVRPLEIPAMKIPTKGDQEIHHAQ